MTERQPRPDLNLLAGFVVGSVTVGLVVLLVLHGVKSLLGVAKGNGVGGFGGYLPQPILGQLGPYPIQPSALANAMQLDNGTSIRTRTDTLTLPVGRGVRVFQAPLTGPTWLVRVHVIGPAGGFASLAVDADPSANGSSAMVVPAGMSTEIRIGARQQLSGAAISLDTQISYVASAEVI